MATWRSAIRPRKRLEPFLEQPRLMQRGPMEMEKSWQGFRRHQTLMFAGSLMFIRSVMFPDACDGTNLLKALLHTRKGLHLRRPTIRHPDSTPGLGDASPVVNKGMLHPTAEVDES